MAFLPFKRLFQQAYVTGDLAAGMTAARALFGIDDFLEFDTWHFAAPDAERPFMRVALAYVGGIMIEIIQPDAKQPGIYAEALEITRPLAFHHFGYMVEPKRFAQLPENLAAAAISIPVARSAGGISFLYADLLDTTGHYAEFVEDGPAWASLCAQVPRQKF